MRELTAWEKYQIEGQRAMTLEELAKAQGRYAKAISKDEMARRQLEAAPGMQNHLWPWQEAETKGGEFKIKGDSK